MRMKNIKDIFSEYGFTAKKAAMAGLSYDTIAKHFQGKRNVGVRAALRYEKLLGIPRWELRPDLWDPPAKAQAEENGAEAQA